MSGGRCEGVWVWVCAEADAGCWCVLVRIGEEGRVLVSALITLMHSLTRTRLPQRSDGRWACCGYASQAEL